MAWFVQPSGQHSSRSDHDIEVCGACIGRTEQREQFCSEYGKEMVTVRVHRQQLISSIKDGMTSQVPEDSGRLTLTSDQTISNRVCRAQQKSCPDTRLLLEMGRGCG